MSAISEGDLVTVEPEYFENTKPGHSKFWEVIVENNDYIALYGVIGKLGSKSVKKFNDHAEARAHAMDMIRDKLRNGYVKTNRPLTRLNAYITCPMLVVSTHVRLPYEDCVECLGPNGLVKFSSNRLTIVSKKEE